MWTPETVKSQLPNVDVRFISAGMPITISCVVRGRKNKFATVAPYEFGSATAWEFSWQAIANSLNSGKPLSV